MTGWYPLFFALVVLFWAFSSPRDRNALRIVLLATIVSFLITEGFTRHIVWAGKLIVPASVETLTILALLTWARNRTGYMQAGLLGIAWLAHALCFYDLQMNTNLVYDNYSQILFWVGVGQLLACYDSVFYNYRAFIGWANRGRTVRLASHHASALHPESGESL